MTVDAPLSWTSSASLAFTAAGSLTVNKPVTVAGPGSVAIQTADEGLSFAPKASLSFWDTGSSLTINRETYTLVHDIKSFAADLQPPNQGGYYAWARDYDAAPDGVYPDSPISGFSGVLNGLGHSISNVSMNLGDPSSSGFIAYNAGVIQNLSVTQAHAEGGTYAGILVGENHGIIDHVRVTGELSTMGLEAGGLAGLNECVETCLPNHSPASGVISNSYANVRISGYPGLNGGAGGLVGQNAGVIRSSYAEGRIAFRQAVFPVGGLVGQNDYRIENCYSLVHIHPLRSTQTYWYGGLIALQTYNTAAVLNSYAAGTVDAAPENPGGVRAGVVGYQYSVNNSSIQPHYANVYWDRDTGVHSSHAGIGNISDERGLTAVSDAQLKSALPPGFDPKTWGQSASINNGYPYLLSNPPAK